LSAVPAGRTPLGLGIAISVAVHAAFFLLLSLVAWMPLRSEPVPIEVDLWREPSPSGAMVERSEAPESKVPTAREPLRKGVRPGRAEAAEREIKESGAEVSPPEVPGESIAERKQQLIEREMERRREWEKSWQRETGLQVARDAGVSGLPRAQDERRAVKGRVLGVQGPLGERRIVSSPLPAYPGWAKKQGIEGEVLLKFWVSPEGLVRSIEPLRLSGFGDFDERALRALQNWRFEPLKADSEQVDQWGTVPFKFRLEKRAF